MSKKYTIKLKDPDILQHDFEKFFLLCNTSTSDIEKADLYLKGYVYLFSRLFKIEENEWLVDPISKEEWDRSIFFHNAKVEQEGLGDVKYVMELNKMYHLVLLARTFYSTGKEEYLNKIYSLLCSWVEIVQYGKSVVNKSMLDISIRSMNLIQVILLCYKNDYFINNIYPLITDILIISERTIRKYSTARWSKYSTGANHLIGEMAGLIIIQKWLEYHTSIKIKHKHYRTEYEYLTKSLDNILTEEGVYLEQSAAYSKIVTEFLMFLDIIVKSNDETNSEFDYDDAYVKMLLDYIETLSYDESLPNFGDNDGAKILASLYRDENSIRHLIEYRKLNFIDLIPRNHLICYRSGQFIWKSNDKFNLYIFTRCGKHSYLPIGSGSHAHNDILSLILCINNMELFIDTGTLYYNSGVNIINSNRSTKNHNTVSIENYEQAEFSGKWLYGSYPNSEILNDDIEIEDKRFVFSGKTHYHNKEHKRKIEYIDGMLNINDTISAEQNDLITFSFLLAPNIKIVQNHEKSLLLAISDVINAEMLFENHIDYRIDSVPYYPSYGIERTTKRIIGHSSITGNQENKITIIFKENL